MIGVFDSGFGGLTVLKGLLEKMPQYSYLYLGDSKNSPYGEKDQELIYSYTKKGVDFLFKKGCELIIIACNTASSQALRKIQQEYLPQKYPNRRVLGVIVPNVEETINNLSQLEKEDVLIGVIGTTATIKSGVYEKELRKISNNLKILSQACPEFVSIVEKGEVDKPETQLTVNRCLLTLKNSNIKILILGCTHFPFLIKQIKNFLGNKVVLINTPEIVADKLDIYLKKHKNIANLIKKNRKVFFYTTKDVSDFQKKGEIFLGRKINSVKKIIL